MRTHDLTFEKWTYATWTELKICPLNVEPCSQCYGFAGPFFGDRPKNPPVKRGCCVYRGICVLCEFPAKAGLLYFPGS